MSVLGNLGTKLKANPSNNGTNESVQGFSVAEHYEGDDTLIAASSYLYFMSGAILILRGDNSEFVRFHSKQAFVLLIVALLALILAPFFWKIAFNLVILILNIYGAYRAALGYKWYIPYLTELANSIPL